MFLFVRMSFDVARSGSVRSWTCTEIRSDLGAVVFCFFSCFVVTEFELVCWLFWSRLVGGCLFLDGVHGETTTSNESETLWSPLIGPSSVSWFVGFVFGSLLLTHVRYRCGETKRSIHWMVWVVEVSLMDFYETLSFTLSFNGARERFSKQSFWSLSHVLFLIVPTDWKGRFVRGQHNISFYRVLLGWN